MMSTPKHRERATPRDRSRRRVLLAASTLFALSAAATLRRAAAMQTQGGTPMPGGWLLAMHWTPVCGQTWLGAAATFVGMWLAMMTAMMLPALVPFLLRVHASPPRATHAICAAGAAAAGYFAVWLGVGALVFATGAPLAAFVMHAPEVGRGVPFAAATVVLAASALQFTGWKTRQLACCGAFRPHASWRAYAWRSGLRYGLHCAACCGNLMAALVAIGMMNLPAMIAVSVAIAGERVAPARVHAARVVGAVGVSVGIAMLARAVR